MRTRKDGEKTRRNILEAACRVFTERGYRDATHAEICRLAGVNTAAINYHFGSKVNLYAETWRKAFHDSLKAHPPHGGVPEDAPPEERLRGRVQALILRIADENNKAFLIVHRELANPTGVLKDVMRECLRPLRQEMTTLVRELLGPGVEEKHVLFCQVSVLSQCLDVMARKRLHRGHPGDKYRPPMIDDIDAYAEHVARFSLAGIKAVRRRYGGQSRRRKQESKGRADGGLTVGTGKEDR